MTFVGRGIGRTEMTLDDSERLSGNRDFILRYRLAGEAISAGLLLYRGQDENFFLLMAEPPQAVAPDDLPPREYIFVLDVSGSMNGFPLDTGKALMRDLASVLRPTDTFNVVVFADGGETFVAGLGARDAAEPRARAAFIGREKRRRWHRASWRARARRWRFRGGPAFRAASCC